MATGIPPPPAISATAMEVMDFAIKFGLAILDSTVLENPRTLHVDFVAFRAKSEFYMFLHTFSPTPPHEMAHRHCQHHIPHIVPMNNVYDALVDLLEGEMSVPSDT
jgi:hypothetical protein